MGIYEPTHRTSWRDTDFLKKSKACAAIRNAALARGPERLLASSGADRKDKMSRSMLILWNRTTCKHESLQNRCFAPWASNQNCDEAPRIFERFICSKRLDSCESHSTRAFCVSPSFFKRTAERVPAHEADLIRFALVHAYEAPKGLRFGSDMDKTERAE